MKPVLIVEDEAIMRDSMRDWLKDEGYEVETAERGEDALEKIGEIDYGIVVLDMKLPGKSGLNVLKEAKAKNPQLKGVIMTAYPSVETAVEAMKIGALDYLIKPVDPNSLEKLIADTLGSVQVEIRPSAPVIEEPVVEETLITEPIIEQPIVEEVKKVRNLVFTKLHPECTLCHFSGYSDMCQLSQAGTCVYHEGIKEMKALRNDCTICQYSGYSDMCEMTDAGTCVYKEGLKEMKALRNKPATQD